jgi:hypothetical protein
VTLCKCVSLGGGSGGGEIRGRVYRKEGGRGGGGEGRG